jgi:hypothetical protein
MEDPQSGLSAAKSGRHLNQARPNDQNDGGVIVGSHCGCRSRLATCPGERILSLMIELPKTRPAGEFHRDHCGSIYSLAVIPLSVRLSDEAVCQVCQMVMNEWRGTLAPIYKLKSRSTVGSK